MRSRDPRFLALVQALAAWRERTAQERDLPRNRIIRDDLLLEVAANRPGTADELARLRRVSLDRRAAAGAVEAVRAALALPQAELPEVEPPPRTPRGLGPMVDLLRVLLKLQCEEHNVAQRLVATGSDLEAIAAEDAPEVAALKGWRYEVFGRAALELKRGELGLAIADGRLALVPMRERADAGVRPAVGGPGSADGRILVVGRGSFLAGEVLRALPAARVRAVGHDETSIAPTSSTGSVASSTSAAIRGSARRATGSAAMDPDLRLARRLGEREIAYLMLSSRKVYAPSARALAEDAPTAPVDGYGRAKLAVEGRLRALLGERLTILRLANVFGYERTPGRATFLASLLERLAKDGEVHYDISPFVVRDFLPVEAFVRLLVGLAQAPPGGILNVGSGIALPTGRLALWIIEGFGRGRLVINSPREHDAVRPRRHPAAGAPGRALRLGRAARPGGGARAPARRGQRRRRALSGD